MGKRRKVSKRNATYAAVLHSEKVARAKFRYQEDIVTMETNPTSKAKKAKKFLGYPEPGKTAT